MKRRRAGKGRCAKHGGFSFGAAFVLFAAVVAVGGAVFFWQSPEAFGRLQKEVLGVVDSAVSRVRSAGNGGSVSDTVEFNNNPEQSRKVGGESRSRSVAEDFALSVAAFRPTVGGEIQELKNIGYVSGFSNRMGVPLWVGYVAEYPFKYKAAARPSKFVRDLRARGSADHGDYSNSGYDRGHMAPNYAIGRCYGAEAQLETFLTTNIIPQTPALNRVQWRELEAHIANVVAQKFGRVLVFVGPVLGENPRKLRGRVAVPEASYAVIMVEDGSGVYMIGFIIPQKPQARSIWDYCVSVDEVERVTGIDFFPQLPDVLEDRLEALTQPSVFK